MRLVYTALLYLALPFILAYLAWRGVRDPAYRRRWHERFGWLPNDLPRGAIWIHAASVGEVQAIARFVHELRRRLPDRAVLITTMTPTGADQVHRRFGTSVCHCYVPFDLPGSTGRFLSTIQPSLAIIAEMEFWPNLYRAVSKRAIPFLLVNARLSQRSTRRYRRLGQVIADTLLCPDRIAVQSAKDARRFRTLGVPEERITVAGNLKLDLLVDETVRRRGAALRDELGAARPVWIAASTREGEEEQVLAAHKQVQRRVPEALLILVPRHPERFDRVAELCRDRGLGVARRSASASPADCDVYLGDTMGELLALYAASDIAFVGGSLVPKGAHNLVEPAALGLPVLVGPYTFNFAAVTKDLVKARACRHVANGTVLGQTVAELLSDPEARRRIGERGRRYIEGNRGATDRMAEEALRLLSHSQHP